MSIVKSNGRASEIEKERVQMTGEIIRRENLDAKIIWHDVEGRTTADARASLGVDASDIAKSILFIDNDNAPHMIVILGHKRIDVRKLKGVVGKSVRIAKPDEVLEYTGIEVGGVNPISCKPVSIYLDKSIMEKEYVHTSAGCSYATLLINTKDLIKYTEGEIVEVSE